MTPWPRITIVTPSYNQAQFLEETITSIISQNYPNLEYFVVDGGSTDDSKAIIEKYADLIDWWVSTPDDGQVDAINKGFTKATGELLCWVNSDDLLLPGCLHSVAKSYLEQGKPDLIHANCVYIDHRSYITRAVHVPKQTRFFMYRGVWAAPAPAVFFKASLMRQVGYLDLQYRLSMDIDIWMKMIQAGGKITYIPQYLGAFRWHETSKSSLSNLSKKFRGQEDLETRKILDSALPQVNERRRMQWRKIWKLYQLINLNYLRTYIKTKKFNQKHWREVFPPK